MPSQVEFLRSVPYFAGFSEQEISQVDRGAVERSFSKGQILFLDGEKCEGLYVVKSGLVRVFKTSPEGREMVMLVARPGDTFNDAPAFDGGLNLVSASALKILQFT